MLAAVLGSFLLVMGVDALVIHSYAASLLFSLVGAGALPAPSSPSDWRSWVILAFTLILSIFGSTSIFLRPSVHITTLVHSAFLRSQVFFNSESLHAGGIMQTESALASTSRYSFRTGDPMCRERFRGAFFVIARQRVRNERHLVLFPVLLCS